MRKIGFVTRNFPPRIGGLERAAFDWYQSISKHGEVRLLAHRGSKKTLLFFIVRAPWVLLRWRLGGVCHVHLHDASLCILLWPWLYLFPKVTCTVHGLDASFPNPLYQALWRGCRGAVSLFLPISEATTRMCRKRGIDDARLKHMPDGIVIDERPHPEKEKARAILRREYPQLPEASLVMLWVGRMVPRKGLLWLVRSVLPSLRDEVCLWVVGDGPEQQQVADVTSKLNLPVRFFGKVSDRRLLELRCAADVAVVPNIPVLGDMEGFGLVSLEANEAGLWVIASDVDGIPSAVHEGMNGTLVRPADVEHWLTTLRYWLRMPDEERQRLGRQAQRYVRETFSWERLAKRWWREVLC
ncbi:glycosyltransferase family 1 protein [Candidatus Parcubacteria bacterium]|nr:MAG: glycosyltransferase family 1 protein [Candidatus Parcubacteria bacterium]